MDQSPPSVPHAQPGLLADRVALVTGVGSGIGKAVARLFAASGAHVIGVERNADSLAETAAEIAGRGERMLPVAADLTSEDEIARVLETARAEAGRIDILANIAGVSKRTPFEEIGLEDFDFMYRLHLRSVFQLTQAVAEGMKQRGFGKIVNTASVSGTRGQGEQAHYSAMKSGIVGLTLSSAKAFGPFGITVNCISPTALTGLTRTYTELVAKSELPLRTTGRMGLGEDVAPSYLFFASPASDYVTGTHLYVDGGYHLGDPA